LGLPSLLKSSSRRSLHSDAKDAAKEAQKAKDAARELEKGRNKLEKERQKKKDKERSESRISMIMNRKRGKVLEIRLSSVHIIDAIPFPDFIFH
jgi:dual specificity tyrosine-phosphorylation-regulated kinase 2/3/4